MDEELEAVIEDLLGSLLKNGDKERLKMQLQNLKNTLGRINLAEYNRPHKERETDSKQNDQKSNDYEKKEHSGWERVDRGWKQREVPTSTRGAWSNHWPRRRSA